MAKKKRTPVEEMQAIIQEQPEFLLEPDEDIIACIRHLNGFDSSGTIEEEYLSDLRRLRAYSAEISNLLQPGEFEKRHPDGIDIPDTRRTLMNLAHAGLLDEFVISPDQPFATLTIAQMEKDIHAALSHKGERSMAGVAAFFIDRKTGPVHLDQLLNDRGEWTDRFRTQHRWVMGAKGDIRNFDVKEAHRLYREGGEFPEERFAALLSIWLMVVDDKTFCDTVPEQVDRRVFRDRVSPLPNLVEEFALERAQTISSAIEHLARRTSRGMRDMPRFTHEILAERDDLDASINARGVWPYNAKPAADPMEALLSEDDAATPPGPLSGRHIREQMLGEIENLRGRR